MKTNGFILASLLAVLAVAALGAFLLIGRAEPKAVKPGVGGEPRVQSSFER